MSGSGSEVVVECDRGLRAHDPPGREDAVEEMVDVPDGARVVGPLRLGDE